MRTGLKKKIGSFHRYRNRKQSSSNSLSTDLTDSGASASHEPIVEGGGGVGVGEGVAGEESVVRLTAEAAANGVSSRDTRSTSKIIFLGCSQDAGSLDSLSVSSTSEFSATGTDERSTSSLGDAESSHSGAMDILVDRIYLYPSGGVRVSESPVFQDMSTEVSGSSCQTVDSGINIQRPKGSTTSKVGQGSTILWIGKVPSPKTASTHSDVLPESDSDTANGEEGEACTVAEVNLNMDVSGTSSTLESDQSGRDNHSRSGTLKDREVVGQETAVNTRHMPSPSPAGTEVIATKLKTEREVFSSALSTMNRDITSASINNSTCSPDLQDANCASTANNANNRIACDSSGGGRKKPMFPPTSKGVLPGSSTPFKPLVRKRSKSSNPCIHKKPKPLPPLTSKTKHSLLTGGGEIKKETVFLSSLPANFKSIPYSCGRGAVQDECDSGGAAGGGVGCTGSSGSREVTGSGGGLAPYNSEHAAISSSPVHGISGRSTPQLTSGDDNQRQELSSGQSSDADLSSGTCMSPMDLVNSDPSAPIAPPRKQRGKRRKRSQVASETQAKSLSGSIESGKLYDLEVDKNDLPFEMVSPEENEVLSPLLDGIERLRIRERFLPHEKFQVHDRNSQNSMTVFDGSNPSSNGSGSARLHSEVYSGDDPYQLNAGERSSTLFSSGISVPTLSNGMSVFNWSAHQLINTTLKVLSPASSKGICLFWSFCFSVCLSVCLGMR